jgi:hypothetical protein
VAKKVKKPRRSLAAVRDMVDKARSYYIQGVVPAEGDRVEIRNPSLEDISLAIGIHRQTLLDRSRKEGWVAQRDAFAKQAMALENEKLLQAMADQHARVRTAHLRASLRLHSTVERKLAAEGEALDMQALSAAGSALQKAQVVSDTAILGPKAMQAQGPVAQVNVQTNVTGWAALTGPPTPELRAQLIALQEAQ